MFSGLTFSMGKIRLLPQIINLAGIQMSYIYTALFIISIYIMRNIKGCWKESVHPLIVSDTVYDINIHNHQ